MHLISPFSENPSKISGIKILKKLTLYAVSSFHIKSLVSVNYTVRCKVSVNKVNT